MFLYSKITKKTRTPTSDVCSLDMNFRESFRTQVKVGKGRWDAEKDYLEKNIYKHYIINVI